MVDAASAARPAGHALRVYQLLGMLVLGWMLGRLPAVLDDTRAEREGLAAALGAAGPSQPARDAASGGQPRRDEREAAALAARVATEVAVAVADATVARLLAAGWGPPPRDTARAPLPAPAAAPPETVVRVIAEARPPDAETLAALGWRLPPAGEAAAREAAPPTPPAAPAAPSAPPDDARARAHALATLGYRQLREGDRRQAVQSLSRALLLDPEAPEAAAWAADVRRLSKRWAVSAYSLSREGTGDPLAASPVLGGGQAGAAVSFTLDPLARRPVSIVARMASAAGPDGVLDPATAEAALGLRWQPLPGIPLALDAERRIALGAFARSAWAARVSGGSGGRARIGTVPLLWDAYGEAGLVGEKRLDLYGGAQARGAVPLFALGNVSLDAGAGLWAAGQRTGELATGRLDFGPSARIALKQWPFSAQVDYRVKAAGNAEPGTGLALTVAGSF